MQLNLGTKIRELRHHDGRTQEALAEALGVTSQAVSRWKSSGSYHDVEIIPSIANYFSVTIKQFRFSYCFTGILAKTKKLRLLQCGCRN